MDRYFYQPTLNIGMIGSVSNGKSSTTRALSNKKTQQHSSELQNDATIKLGYANAKIFKCDKCPNPSCYQSSSSEIMEKTCCYCFEKMQLVKHVSFVDCPGHNTLMATMLNGTCVMNSSIIIESGTNKISELPASQTRDHIDAISISNIPVNIVCLNKLDLINRDDAKKKLSCLKEYMDEKNIKAPMIPISANHKLNTDVILEYICNIPDQQYNKDDDLKMIVIRSFDINKPGKPIDKLLGGVVGGSIIQGTINLNDKIAILPGFLKKENDIWYYKPYINHVLSLRSEENVLEYARPGGLIAANLDIDPGLTSGDKLVGSIIISENSISNYKVCDTFFIKFDYFGEKTDNKLEKNQDVVLNYNANNIPAKVERVKLKNKKIQIAIKNKPVCVMLNDYITISKLKGRNLTIIARGIIEQVNEINQM